MLHQWTKMPFVLYVQQCYNLRLVEKNGNGGDKY